MISKLDITSLACIINSSIENRLIMNMQPAKFVYWFRFFLAIIAAFLCFLLKLKGFSGILLTILLYIFSCIFVKYGLKLGEKELKGEYKFISIGIGIFIMIWVLVWITLYTLFPY